MSRRRTVLLVGFLLSGLLPTAPVSAAYYAAPTVSFTPQSNTTTQVMFGKEVTGSWDENYGGGTPNIRTLRIDVGRIDLVNGGTEANCTSAVTWVEQIGGQPALTADQRSYAFTPALKDRCYRLRLNLVDSNGAGTTALSGAWYIREAVAPSAVFLAPAPGSITPVAIGVKAEAKWTETYPAWVTPGERTLIMQTAPADEKGECAGERAWTDGESVNAGWGYGSGERTAEITFPAPVGCRRLALTVKDTDGLSSTVTSGVWQVVAENAPVVRFTMPAPGTSSRRVVPAEGRVIGQYAWEVAPAAGRTITGQRYRIESAAMTAYGCAGEISWNSYGSFDALAADLRKLDAESDRIAFCLRMVLEVTDSFGARTEARSGIFWADGSWPEAHSAISTATRGYSVLSLVGGATLVLDWDEGTLAADKTIKTREIVAYRGTAKSAKTCKSSKVKFTAAPAQTVGTLEGGVDLVGGRYVSYGTRVPESGSCTYFSLSLTGADGTKYGPFLSRRFFSSASASFGLTPRPTGSVRKVAAGTAYEFAFSGTVAADRTERRTLKIEEFTPAKADTKLCASQTASWTTLLDETLAAPTKTVRFENALRCIRSTVLMTDGIKTVTQKGPSLLVVPATIVTSTFVPPASFVRASGTYFRSQGATTGPVSWTETPATARTVTARDVRLLRGVPRADAIDPLTACSRVAKWTTALILPGTEVTAGANGVSASIPLPTVTAPTCFRAVVRSQDNAKVWSYSLPVWTLYVRVP